LERCKAAGPTAGVGVAVLLVVAGASAAVTMRAANVPPLSPAGEVVGLAVAAGNVYVQGTFARFGPYTGGFAVVGRSTARRQPTVDAVSGAVEAIVSDGGGGWFVGGLFDHVGSVACENLAHLTADGRLDPRFCLDPDRDVLALALQGKTLYVGGAFDSIGGEQRKLIASLDAETGAINVWHPSASGDHVETIAVAGSTVYVGGRFTALGGAPRRHLAALDARTGNALPWNPRPDDFVFDMTLFGSTLFVGGGFTRVDGETRVGVAAFDAQTGQLTSWRADLTWSLGSPDVYALAGRESTLYIGGLFDHVDGLPRDGLAAVETVSGAVVQWRPPLSAITDSLVVAGDTVYAGGDFFPPNKGKKEIGSLLAIAADTGALANWRPDPNDTVDAIVVAGDKVAVGGGFASVGDAQPRPCLAAVTPAGRLMRWRPRMACDPLDVDTTNGIAVSGQDVFTLAKASDSLNDRLTVTDARTGRVKRSVTFSLNVSCDALAAVGSRVYIVGSFNRIAGVRRSNLAALDRTSLRALAWNPRANGGIDSLAASRGTVWVAGTFTRIGGARRVRLASLDTRSGQAKAWNPHVNGPVDSITRFGSTIYLHGSFTKVGNVQRPFGLAAVDAVSGRPRPWNPRLLRRASGAILITGSVVYVVLEQSPSGRPAQIIALDRRSGAPLNWKPEPPERGFFAPGNTDAIDALAASRGRLIIGGGFEPYLVTTALAHSSRR
jgi:outer membrane protein assembly factor BamB